MTFFVLILNFLDVRQEITPKAGWVPMYALAILAYVGCTIAFALIFVAESQKSTTETIVSSYDRSGSDGYSCQMISKVTASYQLASSDGEFTILAYDLVNVAESKSQFEEDINSADPCSQPLVYFPGSSSTLAFNGVTFYAAAMYKSEFAFANSFGNVDGILVLSISEGTKTTFYPSSGNKDFSIAAATNGALVYTSYMGSDMYTMYTAVLTNGVFSEIELMQLNDVPQLLLNDNVYNVYLLSNFTFYMVNMNDALPATLTTLFSIPNNGEQVLNAAVYNSGNSIKVYYTLYVVGPGPPGASHCKYWDQAADATFSFPCNPNTVGIAVDGLDRVYTVALDSLTSGKFTHILQ